MLSTVERMELLKKVPMFDTIPVERLRVVAAICVEKQYSKGDVIFRQADPGDELYIVIEGKVCIGLYDSTGEVFTRLAIYETGGVFGEMILFHGGKRSASAVALNAVMMLALHADALIALLHQYPDLGIEMLKTLSERLRSANARIEELHSATRRDRLMTHRD